ncbi:FAD:protein FMN transferase ApbE [Buchnera aphidicola (Hyadaphis tataricae)]|uniref:FAD:protein FMN transferase n=1 Tax=Buchnera aphidicola (Hyadaphis tataricae) TaxID=1241859 RepID=A0A4D6XVT3_9GAMM|nr:FAD:protein FMN transferase [Buchnera aphidicola]QCI21536.1 FAD:protein FMN transferase ApbE [Buchnera aphidicola (Hyadaphis tataricae)]
MSLKKIFGFFVIFFYITVLFCNQFLTKKIQNSMILQGKTMGTYWKVKTTILQNKTLIYHLIQKTLNQDENMISSWKKQSIVSKFNKLKKNELQSINKNFYHILLTALKINKKTYGKLDITISSLINIWGFGNKDKPMNYPSIKKIKKKLSLSGSQHLKIIKNHFGIYLKKNIDNIQINLSTLGEGFAADHVAYVLKKNKIKNFTVAVGGAVVVQAEQSEQPKVIAIQKPIDNKQSVHLMINLKNNAISTSGTYRNYYYLQGKRISHLIDPENGKPITHNLVSVSVITNTALEADGWDTGLLVLGFKKAKKIILQEKLAACLITKNKHSFSTWISPQFRKFLVS